MPFPEIDQNFAYGAPASTPSLEEMIAAWKTITQAADPWLDTLTIEKLQENLIGNGKPIKRRFGDLLQRTIYHYWYHTGENMAIRQQLGHTPLPQFVGRHRRTSPLSARIIIKVPPDWPWIFSFQGQSG